MGQVGSAFKNPNTFAPEPSGFSGSEWTARLLGDTGKGLLGGVSKQFAGNQNASPASAPMDPMQFVPKPQAIQGPGTGDMDGLPARKRNPFFGGYGV